MAREILPVADREQVRAYARRLTLKYPRELGVALLLHGLAAVAGLLAPWQLGKLVQNVQYGAAVDVPLVAAAIGAFLLLQGVLIRYAVLASAKLGEKVLAELREEFVDRVLALPLSTVERAGSGDLITRTSRDVDALSRTVRHAVPETLIAIVTFVITVGALLLVSPLLMLPMLAAGPILYIATRWYLARARDGYLRENAAYADITEGLAETIEGARAVEALGLRERRRVRTDRDIARSYAAERYTLGLRTTWYPAVELGYVIPVVAALLVGGLFYTNDWVTLAQVTTAALYAQQLIDPLDRFLMWIDELQVGGASMARLLGVSNVPHDRHPTSSTPASDDTGAAPTPSTTAATALTPTTAPPVTTPGSKTSATVAATSAPGRGNDTGPTVSMPSAAASIAGSESGTGVADSVVVPESGTGAAIPVPGSAGAAASIAGSGSGAGAAASVAGSGSGTGAAASAASPAAVSDDTPTPTRVSADTPITAIINGAAPASGDREAAWDGREAAFVERHEAALDGYEAALEGKALRASDVRYAYREGRDVLHGVSLTVRPGERLAVVGPSGAGKSTLGRLLAGIHGPRTGSVTVGGVPLVELPLDELRGQVALVTQEHHVFKGTIRDNLIIARPDADDSAVAEALEAVDALDWVLALPGGLDTEVGSGGHAVSPAQAQQLALARLVLADPHTLVLDEATSLIDPRSARDLERSLAAVLEGRTVIAIAHRLYTAHDADRVAVVEDGRITELGSHDELVAAGGSYAALWRSWHGTPHP
ncbi:ABC transporter ATP-binding protein [Nonomuraea sp. NPDC049309]|uniref:ABC transporter ATP-binding protein n=1 Tax=Nonomuraea sp. NPDC049309 TaxID=3364350 RepID=UPI00370F8A45